MKTHAGKHGDPRHHSEDLAALKAENDSLREAGYVWQTRAETLAEEVERWKAECSGLGGMLLKIDERYKQAREQMGGDSELLWSSITTYKRYVNDILRKKLGPA